MKINKFLLGLFGAAALTACSSDEPSSTPPVEAEGENFITVSLEMSAPGSRADFEDGTEEESKVCKIVFFFFDDADKCVDIQMIDDPEFTKPTEPSVNPAITKYGEIEVRLKSGLTYKKVAVALNSSAADANTLKQSIKTIGDLEARALDYVANIEEDGSHQMMSNSIYFDMPNAATKPTEEKKVSVITIDKEKNIYTSAQRPNIKELIASGEKAYVDIYVERVAARIDVSEATFDMEKYYIYKEGETLIKSITLFDHANLASEEIKIVPVVQGMCLNVLTPTATMIKPININEVGYQVGDGQYKAFQWNDPLNKRSYWATTAFIAATQMRYYSWNDAVNQGAAAFTQYIHPNTQDFTPEANNEVNSKNTKVMVTAILCQDGDPTKPLDLVRYGADYMLSENLLSYAANQINVAVRNIDWDNAGVTVSGAAATAEQLTQIKTSVADAFVDGLNGDLFALTMLNVSPANQPGNCDWEAKVVKTEGFDYSIAGLDATLVDAAKAVIDDVIDETLVSFNEPAILYWKGGRTYFFTSIRHQGFQGLTGTGDSDYLFGVVRNHLYKVTLSGIYGLGTPVIEPGKPINPDRPGDERPSYISARISILPWRVVPQNVSIH